MLRPVLNYELPKVLMNFKEKVNCGKGNGGGSSGGSGGYDGLAKGCGPMGNFGGRGKGRGQKNK